LWVFLSVGAVALFGVFLPITTWLEARRKEREAYYKAETMRRVTESSTDGGKASIEYLREVNRMAQFRTIEGLKIGGVIMIAIGIGVVTLLWFVAGHELAACGLVPGLIGVAMLVYVYMLAPRVE
jgi:Flp pilus assembly protein TadB